MKIVVAPDSFKGSLSAVEASEAIAAGLRRVVPGAQIIEIPMADGGEGTVDALVISTGGTYRKCTVCGPLAEKLEASYGILGDDGESGRQDNTAVIEMAAAAGLPLVPVEKRNPLYTTTYGLGELIRDALKQDCSNFIIGIGGSATNDCGCGMAQALGVRFFDESGDEITTPMTGELIGKVGSIDIGHLTPEVQKSHFVIASDVTNPLLGPDGASRVYSPQKGADPQTVEVLESNMTHIIKLIEDKIGKQVRNMQGAGAAGGLGAGLMAFLGARMESGVEVIMRYSRFAEKIKSSDLVITGEGRIDSTTASGKTISGIAAAAQKYSVPVIALAGSIESGGYKLLDMGVQSILPICSDTMSVQQAMQQAAELIADTAEQTMRSLLIR